MYIQYKLTINNYFDTANAIPYSESSLITSNKYMEVCKFDNDFVKNAIAYSDILLILR